MRNDLETRYVARICELFLGHGGDHRRYAKRGRHFVLLDEIESLLGFKRWLNDSLLCAPNGAKDVVASGRVE